jgi:hypothetical protein
MKQFSSYVSRLESLAQRGPRLASEAGGPERISAALDGQPLRELRKAVGVEEQRASGAFFTGARLAQLAVRNLVSDAPRNALFFDPACGAGDLLIACARAIALSRNYEKTLEKWGNALAGIDVHQPFVRAAKARLAILAIQRGAKGSDVSIARIDESFPRLTCGDGLKSLLAGHGRLHIALNPPYTMTNAPPDCDWAHGSVSLAALFIDHYVRQSQPGTRIAAILPEVLRTGSRYAHWRREVQAKAEVTKCRVFGRFAPWADVDVFMLDLAVGGKRRRHRKEWWCARNGAVDERVEDHFSVHVGAVVPHRDPKSGPSYPFIHAKMLPKWRIQHSIKKRRRFSGRTFTPPFVVVRRTSRPGDSPRAVATIITGNEDVAVENHLIVLLPKDRTLDTCRLMMRNLRSEKTDQWLDGRIRCRHLTVTALRRLPWRRARS